MFSIPFQVNESILIHAPLEKVFAKVANFSDWIHWSPWLCQNQNAKIEVSGDPANDGHKQKWDGDWIGSGEICLTKVNVLKDLQYELSFLKPWKSKAYASFEFFEVDQGIMVTWKLQSTLPIFLFFLKKNMIALIASDYKRGLIMLKHYVEAGGLAAKTTMHGVQKLPSYDFVGQREACTLKEMGDSMEKNFSVLHKFVQDEFYPKPDFYFSIYHKYDLVNGICDYTAAMGYYEKKPAEDYLKESGHVPAHEAIRVNQKGEYKFLGNAWAAAMGFQRHKKLTSDKSIDMYEKYVAVPPEAQNDQISTDICIPVI